ncbi:hypothetical protein [Bradyrhizobium centrosematis]|uniref:hypothetical protein n=1 Tax=Bradyrhizobium centrosematis TaxID=1300039 RepID=UPI002168C83C|nr:hypothetical protein [Bradyrhizobium centrosematis]MCS3758660.1 hypothetical protein [Bradyrhizobium centrosematis]MCS3773452.1 hypothetical protein [Bradyrhizobium centrosematis]
MISTASADRSGGMQTPPYRHIGGAAGGNRIGNERFLLQIQADNPGNFASARLAGQSMRDLVVLPELGPGPDS